MISLSRLSLASAVALIVPFAAWAEVRPNVAALSEALGIPEILQVMAQEGLGYGEEVEAQLFPGRGGTGWEGAVERLYNPTQMQATIEAGLEADLSDTQVASLLAFFASEQGQRIIGFEISARQAMTDEDIEAAAKDAYASMRRADDPRLELLDAFTEANDLVEFNVMGAMNASVAFSLGLLDGNAFGNDLSQEQILRDVWAQEDEIRRDTEEWVYAFQSVAYGPLEDADIEAYIAISKTPEGQELNRSLFAAFDEMYVGISRGMGLAAARYLGSEDI